MADQVVKPDDFEGDKLITAYFLTFYLNKLQKINSPHRFI